MNIALIGYGKMGKAIEQIALQHGHHIVLKINSANVDQLDHLDNYTIDVAIEFTNPSSAKENVLKCLKKQIPVVCGTTGWKEQVGSVELATAQFNTAFLIASNFSIGVNLFFELNSYLANLMNNYTDYAIQIKETHHTAKKDAPSGTAISLAEQIIEQNEIKKQPYKEFDNQKYIDILKNKHSKFLNAGIKKWPFLSLIRIIKKWIRPVASQ